MRKRNTVSLVALFAIAMMAAVHPAWGEPPWPEAHSGAYLGVQITAVTPQRASALKLQEPAGAIITYVDQDGPACRAGLMENDVVVAFDGSKISDPVQLQGLIHTSPAQKLVTLTIIRNGLRKDVKVTLGSWNVMSHARANPNIDLGSPAPPRPFVPDMEVPSFTVLSVRHGLVVESLSPQLADFFGVARGHGVLVRSVEGGSPAAAAGLKAGDVILKVNNESVRDMADWQRGMQASANKIWIVLWRDKREQNFVITVPGSGDASRLLPGDHLDFDTQAQMLRDRIEQLRPGGEPGQNTMVAQLGPSEKELKKMQREVEKSMKRQQKDIDKMSKDLAASVRPTQKEFAQMQQDIQRSMPSQKDLDQMKRQFQESMPSQKDFADMQAKVQASMPTQNDLDEMRRQVESSMKSWTPQFQQEMEQLQKQMEQQKLDLQRMMQDFNNNQEF